MKPEKPSELEMQILGTLWRNGPLTVREVLTRMPDEKQRAYTSILSVMQVMEKKGLLTRTREGLADRWRPKVKESQILGPFMKKLVSNIFGGQAASAMQCLLKESELDREQLAEIRKLLDSYAPQAGRKSSKKP
jgi:BlaI family transcriptional regulator, penicillinase repressor